MTRALAIVGLLLAASLAHAQDGGTISIIKPEPGVRPARSPEPWLAPKYQTPRSERVAPAPSQAMPPPLQGRRTPPDLYVPQTGRVVPNLPTLSPNGIETSQDRAMRCAHQSGMAGAAGGDANAYLGTCVNQ